MYDIVGAEVKARELRTSHGPLEAVLFIAQHIVKAIFRGNSCDVLYWAFVYASYVGGKPGQTTDEEVNAFRDQLLASFIEALKDPDGVKPRPRRRQSKR